MMFWFAGGSVFRGFDDDIDFVANLQAGFLTLFISHFVFYTDFTIERLCLRNANLRLFRGRGMMSRDHLGDVALHSLLLLLAAHAV